MVVIHNSLLARHLITAQVTATLLLVPHAGEILSETRSMH